MNHRLYCCISLLIFFPVLFTNAQKPFAEGIITYKVSITPSSDDNDIKYTGTYTITVKGNDLRKELKLKNGYEDILICNTIKNTVYSLKTINGKNYAIQLDTTNIINNQAPYKNFSLTDLDETKKIAKLEATKGSIKYEDGSSVNIFYTKEWYPSEAETFDHFPGIKVLPLSYTYKNQHGATINLTAEKVDATIVENSNFRIPHDYKIISYSEYKQMNK